MSHVRFFLLKTVFESARATRSAFWLAEQLAERCDWSKERVLVECETI